MRGGSFNGALRQQAPAFGKGDEQQAVNQLLCMAHQVGKSSRRVKVVQAKDEFLAQGFVVVIERLGNLALLQGVGLQQIPGCARQQVGRAQ